MALLGLVLNGGCGDDDPGASRPHRPLRGHSPLPRRWPATSGKRPARGSRRLFLPPFTFVDEFFPKDARASAQGRFNFLILVFGPFVGNKSGPSWRIFSRPPKASTLVSVHGAGRHALADGAAACLVFFHRRRKRPKRPPEKSTRSIPNNLLGRGTRPAVGQASACRRPGRWKPAPPVSISLLAASHRQQETRGR